MKSATRYFSPAKSAQNEVFLYSNCKRQPIETEPDNNPHDLIWEEGNQPFSQRFGDHFYSRNDGRAECDHVFIKGNDLPMRWPHTKTFQIAELGFGTGLNFFETWRQWRVLRQPGQQLIFTSFEAYPLETEEIARAMVPWPELSDLMQPLLHQWPQLSNTAQLWKMDDQTHLEIVKADALAGVMNWQNKADAWYLDGFSPQHNTQMWSAELMQQVFDHTTSNGTFATYTSAGWVRRNLIEAGFEVEKIKGHGRKRHMLTGKRETQTT